MASTFRPIRELTRELDAPWPDGARAMVEAAERAAAECDVGAFSRDGDRRARLDDIGRFISMTHLVSEDGGELRLVSRLVTSPAHRVFQWFVCAGACFAVFAASILLLRTAGSLPMLALLAFVVAIASSFSVTLGILRLVLRTWLVARQRRLLDALTAPHVRVAASAYRGAAAQPDEVDVEDDDSSARSSPHGESRGSRSRSPDELS